MASSSMSLAGRSRYSRMGTCTFSSTVRAENKAPCWNNTPSRISIRTLSESLILSTSSPKRRIVRERLGVSPSTVRNSADLPEPEAPTQPRISPRLASSDRLCETVFGPNATVTSAADRTTSPCPSASGSAMECSLTPAISEIDRRVEHGEKSVEHDDHENRLHDRGCDLLSEDRKST